MNEITKINTANVHEFILKFVPDISVEHLKPVPDHLRGGDNFTFYYRDNSILKIPENECRDGLLKEAKLTEYLNTQQLPVAIPKLLQSHDQGFYALFSRIGRPSLAVEALEGFTHASLEALAQSLGTFLSFLHNHTFPEEVLGYIPRAEDTFEWTLSESRQQIACIEERAKEVDTARWKERLERLQESLVQKWAVLHCDLQLNHLFCVPERADELAIIDFGDALVHDPAIDLSEFAIEMYSDLNPDGVLARKIIDLVLKNYQTDDLAIEEKIEFGLLAYEIRQAYQRVR